MIPETPQLYVTLKRHSDCVLEMKRLLWDVIPNDFTWSFVVDDHVRFVVRWRWNGIADVQRFGRCQDEDYSICYLLLRRIDWVKERKLANDSVVQAPVATLRRDEGQPCSPLGVRPDSAAAVGVVHSAEAMTLPRARAYGSRLH